jgi:hypothetical protein
MSELNDKLYSEYINGKLITFNEFLHIYDKIKENDYQFEVKYTLTPVEPYLVTDSYILEHNSFITYLNIHFLYEIHK